METITNCNETLGSSGDGWEAWEAVPRDGPAIFVIDTLALNRQGQLRGRWLDLSVGPEQTEAALSGLLGRPIDAAWAIVDQVGLGPRMAPETMRLDELHQLRQHLTAEEDSA